MERQFFLSCTLHNAHRGVGHIYCRLVRRCTRNQGDKRDNGRDTRTKDNVDRIPGQRTQWVGYMDIRQSCQDTWTNVTVGRIPGQTPQWAGYQDKGQSGQDIGTNATMGRIPGQKKKWTVYLDSGQRTNWTGDHHKRHCG